MFEASFQFIFQIYFFYKISRLLDWLISSSKLQKIEKKVSLVSWPVFLNHFVCNSLLNSCVLYATRADRWRDWHCDITCLIFQIKCPVFFFVTASFLSFFGGGFFNGTGNDIAKLYSFYDSISFTIYLAVRSLSSFAVYDTFFHVISSFISFSYLPITFLIFTFALYFSAINYTYFSFCLLIIIYTVICAVSKIYLILC